MDTIIFEPDFTMKDPNALSLEQHRDRIIDHYNRNLEHYHRTRDSILVDVKGPGIVLVELLRRAGLPVTGVRRRKIKHTHRHGEGFTLEYRTVD